MTNILRDIIPTKARRWAYALYALIVLGEGATQVGYATAGADQPTALLVAIAITAYVGGAMGLVAASNATEAERPEDAELGGEIPDGGFE